MRRVITLTAASIALFTSFPAYAEELDAIFKRVTELVEQKNYPKALEELTWARKEIEKMNSGSVKNFFPDSLSGYTGGKAEVNNAMGFMNIERTYSKSNKSVRVSLTGGSGGGGGLGGLAQLGKMAAMFGGQEGQDTFRIGGRTAVLNNQEGSAPQLQVFLDSGSVLTLDADDGVPASDLRAMANEIKIDDLDKYLRGQAG